MGITTRMTVGDDPGYDFEGVPTIERRSGSLTLVHGNRRIALDSLDEGAEVSLAPSGGRLDGDPAPREVARVVRTMDGVYVETGLGQTVYRSRGEDTRNAAFAAYAIDVVVDDVVVASHPLFDESRAAVAGRRHLDRLGVARAGTVVRDAPGLPPRETTGMSGDATGGEG